MSETSKMINFMEKEQATSLTTASTKETG